MKTFRILLFLLLFSFIVACEKDEVIGPQGPQGATGVTGPTGATGSNGATGNANVSEKIIIVSNWAYQLNYWYANVVDSAITQNIVDKGAVIVYYEISPGEWSMLPYSYPYTIDPYEYSFIYSLNNVFIKRRDLSSATPNPGTQTFKIVIIVID